MSATEQENADVHILRKAMSSLNTNEQAMISIIAPLKNDRCVPFQNAFNTTLSRDLHRDIKRACRGDFERAILACVTEVNEYDATCMREAVQGLGTNEAVCSEILCTRTDAELKQISHAYASMYNQDLTARMHSETGAQLRRVYELVLGGRSDTADIADCVQQLYDAGEGKIGTNEKVFVDILAGHTRVVCEAIAEAYLKTRGKSLIAVIKSEFSGNLRDALLPLVTPVPLYYAQLFESYVKRMNVNEKAVIRIIRSRKEKDLTEISAALQGLKNGKPLIEWCTDKLSGDFKRLMVAVCANFAS